MGYKKSYSLGQDSKDIIYNIENFGADVENSLHDKKADFYKRELLNYINSDYNPKKGKSEERDKRETFKKLMLILSFEAADKEEYQEKFVEILIRHKEFKDILVPALDKDLLSENPENISGLNHIAFDRVLHKKDYVPIVTKIIDKNINSEKLHKVIYSELTLFGKDDPINREMLNIYMNHPKLNPKMQDNILNLWSKKVPQENKGLNIEEQEQRLINYINTEYMRRRKIKGEEMSPEFRTYLVTSVGKNNKLQNSKKFAEEAVDELVYAYESYPELKNAIFQSIENVCNDSKFHKFSNYAIRGSQNYPEITSLFIEAIKRKPFSFKAPSVAFLPSLAKKYPQFASEYIAVTAKAIRNSHSSGQIYQVFNEVDPNIEFGKDEYDEKFRAENEDEFNDVVDKYKTSEDYEDLEYDDVPEYRESQGFDRNVLYPNILNDNYKYLTHVAFNDSQMSSYDALNLSDNMMHVLMSNILGDTDYDEEEGDIEAVFDYENKDKYKILREYLDIIDESYILRQNPQIHAKYVAGLKNGEIIMDYPQGVKNELNRIVEKNIKTIEPVPFIEELLGNMAETVEVINNALKEDEPRHMHKIDERAFDFVESYVKRVKFTPEQKEDVIAILDELKVNASQYDIEKYDNIILNVRTKQEKTFNPQEQYIRKRFGKSGK